MEGHAAGRDGEFAGVGVSTVREALLRGSESARPGVAIDPDPVSASPTMKVGEGGRRCSDLGDRVASSREFRLEDASHLPDFAGEGIDTLVPVGPLLVGLFQREDDAVEFGGKFSMAPDRASQRLAVGNPVVFGLAQVRQTKGQRGSGTGGGRLGEGVGLPVRSDSVVNGIELLSHGHRPAKAHEGITAPAGMLRNQGFEPFHGG